MCAGEEVAGAEAGGVEADGAVTGAAPARTVALLRATRRMMQARIFRIVLAVNSGDL